MWSKYFELAILQSQEISEWERKVYEILRPLERGSMIGPLSPQIFDLTMLQNIVHSAKDLTDTVYKQDPSYLYHTPTATLIEINDNTADYSFHLILQVPVIKTNHAYPYYAVRQTSFTVKNNCYFQFPWPTRIRLFLECQFCWTWHEPVRRWLKKTFVLLSKFGLYKVCRRT